MPSPADLKNIGLKATVPRLKILEIFQTSEERHLSAEDVYRILLAEHMDIGLATVYRVLTQFEQAGLLSRNNFESGKAIYELNEGKHHDHLVCLDCGHILEFENDEIEALQEKEDAKGMKAKQREKVRPKLGKIDIDYQKLHDAFFKWQTKPRMTMHGDLYYEGKEFEIRYMDDR